MYRIFRPGHLLASAGLLLGASAAHGADYVLDDQVSIGVARPSSANGDFTEHDAYEPAIATAPEQHLALFVWAGDDAYTRAGDDGELHLANDEFEIYGRLVTTSNLNRENASQRLSFMGDDLESDAAERAKYDARNPAVAWNPVAGEFLVVWEGDGDTAPLVDDEFEIFAQRVGIDGQPVGERVRISIMGDDAAAGAERTRYDAANPSIAVDPLGNYLVVWEGDTDAAPLVDDEKEIFGRYLDSTATPAGGQFRISFVGDDSETDAAVRAARDATRPQVIFNGGDGVVAWQADDSLYGLADDEHEIFLQHLGPVPAPDPGCTDPLCPVEWVPAGDPVRVSTMGSDGDAAFDGLQPALTSNPNTRALLVAWHGDTSDGALVDEEQEVFARLFDESLAPLGAQFRVSTMGTDTETDTAKRARYDATAATAEWSDSDGVFFIAWRGDTDTEFEIELGDEVTEVRSLVDDEFEIFGRLLHADGVPLAKQFRVSIQGNDLEDTPEDRVKFGADAPAVAFANGVLLTGWSGDSNVPGTLDDGMQVFAVRVAALSTELEMVLESDLVAPTVPAPIRVDFSLDNNGTVVARNVAVRVEMSNEFPLSFEGCEAVTDNTCELGDIAPGEAARFSVILATDHLELDDTLGTTLSLTTRADTGLSNIGLADGNMFVAASVTVKGGGSAGAFWLLLAGAGVWRARNRRR